MEDFYFKHADPTYWLEIILTSHELSYSSSFFVPSPHLTSVPNEHIGNKRIVSEIDAEKNLPPGQDTLES